MIKIKVNVKSIANKKSRIKTFDIPYSDNVNDVRSLIEETVGFCVNDYNERKQDSELIRVLTPQIIEDKAASGKVSFGANYGERNVDLQKATEDALEAFFDGIVVIFADERQLERLEENIDLLSVKSLTFVKLTMLSGRIW